MAPGYLWYGSGAERPLTRSYSVRHASDGWANSAPGTGTHGQKKGPTPKGRPQFTALLLAQGGELLERNRRPVLLDPCERRPVLRQYALDPFFVGFDVAPSLARFL